MRSKRPISWRTLRIVRCAKAASVCHKVSSDQAPSTSPCQVWNCPFGALARTAAMMSGTPAAAAMMRMARRRVGCVCSGMIHHGGGRLGVLGFLGLIAQLGGPHQRRAALVVIVFDLAIQALEALGSLDLAARLDRAHWARALAEVTRIAAFGTALEQIDEMQTI